eukprot:5099635-Pyramimonas_sp.AAC.1
MSLAGLAEKAKLMPAGELFSSPLDVAGVGNGSLVARWEVRCPIAVAARDGAIARRSVRAPVVEYAGFDLPPFS